MSCVVELLEGVGRDAEPQIRGQLGGFFGAIVRQYLPQTWVFRTEDGAASFHVDPTGYVTVTPGASSPVDVTIEIGHERLKTALKTRRKESTAPGPLHVTAHTAKGRAAFDYLRGRLGL